MRKSILVDADFVARSSTDYAGQESPYHPFNTGSEESECYEDDRVEEIGRLCNKRRAAKLYFIRGVADNRSFQRPLLMTYPSQIRYRRLDRRSSCIVTTQTDP